MKMCTSYFVHILYLIIFLRVLNLDIFTSTPPLGCLHCVIFISIQTLQTDFRHIVFCAVNYIFSFFLDVECRHFFYIHNTWNLDKKNTSAALMGYLLCVICYASISIYTLMQRKNKHKIGMKFYYERPNNISQDRDFNTIKFL